MFKFHDVEQNSEEWDLLRAGKITSSGLARIMAHSDKDKFGEPAIKYAVTIALGQITGEVVPQAYTNSDMDRGHEDEVLARLAYEEKYFCTVGNGGFFSLNDVGCSPDGLIGDDGVVEFKTANDNIHYDRIIKQTYDSTYKWQLVGNLKFTRRNWIDFVSFCPAYPEDKRLYVKRCYKQDFEKEFAQVDIRLVEFRALIDKVKQNILKSNYSLI